jgi:hypothetical protein
MTRIRAAWRSLPPAIRSGVITALVTFAGALCVAVLGLLDAVRQWLETGDPIDYGVATKAAVSAVIALASGVVNAIYRAIRPPALSYPDSELLAQQHRDAVNRIGRAAGDGRL